METASPQDEMPWYYKALALEKIGCFADALRCYRVFIELAEIAPRQDAQQIAHVQQRLRELEGR